MKSVYLPTLDYPPQTGGVARYLFSIKQTLGDDVEVDVLEDGLGRFSLFWHLWRRAANYNQVWTSHVLPIGTMLLGISFIRKCEYSVFLHGMDFDLARRSPWKRWLTKRILNRATNVFCNTKALAREVELFSGRTAEVVYPCVSDAFVESSYVLQKQTSAPGDEVRLLTVARLVERKGHMDVLNVVKTSPNLSYTIVGDGVMRPVIERFVAEHGLEDRVTILQSVCDRKLPDVYSHADIFVMPTKKTETDREGFGIVYLEAQLFGLPVVAMKHPGVDEAVEDGVGGVLVEQLEGLEGAIRTLATDAKLRAQLGASGRQFVLKRFTREKQFGVLRSFL